MRLPNMPSRSSHPPSRALRACSRPWQAFRWVRALLRADLPLPIRA